MPQERILVAEDQDDVRRMCLRTLKLVGYDVTGVGSGREAIDLASKEPFDLLVTDLKMPRMGGLEAYREIHEFQPGITAVVMTGYGTMESAIEALQLGVSEFILKPFGSKKLVETVERALVKRRLQAENARLKTLIPLFELSQVFMSSVDLEAIPAHVVRIAKKESQADSASLMLLDEKGALRIHSALGLPADVVANTQKPAGEGIAGYAVTHREPVIVQGDLESDSRFGDIRPKSQIRSAISLPLIHKEKVLGVLNVSRIEDPTPFAEGDVELLSVLGSQAAIAIENARMFQEIQEAYQRLAELDYLKSEFINIAAHELRSPLAVVLAYATLLEGEATGTMHEHLGQLVQAAQQLRSIIDDMISLQAVDAGQAEVELKRVEIADVVDDAYDDLHLLAERKNQTITVDLPGDLSPVRADAQKLYLILTNLLSNAIKFTPEEGSIRITAREDGDRVLTSISDTGIGIAEEELSRIFERFYQVEDSLRRKHGGIGLGLAIAREMAELMDGQIELESKPGEGSRFTIILPKAQP